jgi:hypothetical protein
MGLSRSGSPVLVAGLPRRRRAPDRAAPPAGRVGPRGRSRRVRRDRRDDHRGQHDRRDRVPRCCAGEASSVRHRGRGARHGRRRRRLVVRLIVGAQLVLEEEPGAHHEHGHQADGGQHGREPLSHRLELPAHLARPRSPGVVRVRELVAVGHRARPVSTSCRLATAGSAAVRVITCTYGAGRVPAEKKERPDGISRSISCPRFRLIRLG